jgi:eukaryotic-like serine/threonine-protein kinase
MSATTGHLGHLRRVLILWGLVMAAAWCPPAFAQRPKQPEPEFTGTFQAPEESVEEETDWTSIIIWGCVAVLLFGVPIYLYWKQTAGTKQKKGIVTGENEIAGYKLRTHLLTGQTSQVWEVVETVSNRHFAMKMLLPEKAHDPEHRRFLFHEAEVGLHLAHPNIIKIVKVFHDRDNPCFVMEFFPSGSLKLRVMHKQDDFIREKALDILKQVATALAFMNAKGWVHRDVKLDNILVNSLGEAKLIDFAIAQRTEKKPSGLGRLFRKKKKVMGTRSYMSPEQIRGEPLDGRADLYSFAACAYELVTGRPPFRGASNQDLLNKHLNEKPLSPRVHNPDVTEEFGNLILRCLAKKRDERPRDFHEVLMALRTMKVFRTEPPVKKAVGK